jgi:hypothetical protein
LLAPSAGQQSASKLAAYKLGRQNKKTVAGARPSNKIVAAHDDLNRQ